MDATDQIRAFVKETFVLDALTPFTDDLSLVESGAIDSLGILKVLLFIEKTYGFQVPEQDVVPDYFESVQSIAAYVNGHLARSARA